MVRGGAGRVHGVTVWATLPRCIHGAAAAHIPYVSSIIIHCFILPHRSPLPGLIVIMIMMILIPAVLSPSAWLPLVLVAVDWANYNEYSSMSIMSTEINI